jgi:glyceraldehyde 3-phosphate dehydrogenase
MDKKKRNVQIGINGMGTIGKLVYRMLRPVSNINVVKVNDLAPKSSLEYLLKHDTVHGKWHGQIQDFEYGNERNPCNIYWSEIDVVVDSTPNFNTFSDLSNHIEGSGECYVIRTSPLKGKNLDKTQTIIIGINDDQLDLKKYKVISMASCTTNCLAPMVKIVKQYCEKTGNVLEELDFVTVHAKTNDQANKDSYHSDPGRGRDTNNIIETSTGASSQIGLFFPELKGKIHGTAYRVPVSDGSFLELRVKTKNPIDIKGVNATFKQASMNEFEDILSYETMPLVSSDCIGDKHTCVYLENSAQQLFNTKIKLGALYDNEFAYASKIVDLIKRVKKDVYDAISKEFIGYESEMSIESWWLDPSPGNCDDISELSDKDIDSSLRTVAEKENWTFTKKGSNYLLGAKNFIYLAEIKSPGVVLYDQFGEIIDLSTNKEMHLANKALVQKYFSKEMYTEEDKEWDRAMECSPDDWEDDD